jgi:hypothetical protein
MPMKIKSGIGNGYEAGVNADKRLMVEAESVTIQHNVSHLKEQAYQCIGVATLTSGTTTALHIRNTSANKIMTITYIRHQIIDQAGGTALPNANNYYRIALGRTYVSDGSAVIPINVYAGSGNSAEVIAYQGNPTLTGTAEEVDRHYTKAEGDMNTFNKEGSLIIPPTKTIELSYVGDQTSGIIYTRISFLMETK